MRNFQGVFISANYLIICKFEKETLIMMDGPNHL